MALSLSLWGLLASPVAGCARREAPLGGISFETPRPAPELRLESAGGGEWSLRDQRGKAVLVYFGYTHCPDICPGTLSLFKQVKKELGREAARTVFVFVSVDPERDTPSVLKKYLSFFDPSFVGLTGSPGQVAAAARAWGVVAEKESPDPSGAYYVTHTTAVFLVDPEGRLVALYPFGVKPDAIAEDVRRVLASSSSDGVGEGGRG